MLKFILSSIILFSVSMDASACSCIGQDIVRAYYGSEAVFAGTVKDIRRQGQNVALEVTLEDIEMFNEYSNSQTITVYTHPSSATCGYAFNSKTSYVVFANTAIHDSHSSKKGELHVSLCSRTSVLSENMLKTLRVFRENPPEILKHMCDRESCELSISDANYLYDLQDVAAADPAATYEVVSGLENNCARIHGREAVLREWVKKDPQSMLERLNGNFTNQLQCLTYEGGYVLDNALGDLEPYEAIAWLEENGVTEHRDGGRLYQNYFSFWMHQDADTAIEWYYANSDKVSSRSLLNTGVFTFDKDLFLSEYKSIEYEEKVRVSLSLVERFERERKDLLVAFISEIDDPKVLEWVNLLISTWEGRIEPSVIFEKTAGSFLAGDKSSSGENVKYPYGLYDVIQLVCLNEVPISVREWIDKTAHLEPAVKADLHAMLDSRQYMFDNK